MYTRFFGVVHIDEKFSQEKKQSFPSKFKGCRRYISFKIILLRMYFLHFAHIQ